MEDIYRILVPIDFSDTADHALDIGLILGKRCHSNTHVLHIEDIPPDWMHLVENVEKALYLGIHEKLDLVKKQLSDRTAYAKDKGVDVQEFLEYNRSYRAILGHAENHNTDLIIMGAHGRLGLKGMLIGSYTQRVLYHSQIPVLAMKKVDQPNKLEKMVFVSDYSPIYANSFHAVINFAEKMNIQLNLLFLNTRIIFNNIRNFVIYLLSCNLSEILVVSSAAFLNWGSPLLPLQILFLNLVTDVFPALALGMGKGNKKIILQQPRALGEPVLTKAHWKSIITYALILTVCVLSAFFYAIKIEGSNAGQANNVAFFTLAFAQLVHPFNLIKRGESIFKNGIIRNRHLWAAIIFCTFLLLVANAVSPFNQLLELQPISKELWIVIGLGSLLPLVLIHILKRLKLIG